MFSTSVSSLLVASAPSGSVPSGSRLPSSDGAQRGGRLKIKRKRKKRGLNFPDSPLIGGSPPRGAGVIALSKGQRGQQDKRLYVCLVTKRTGIESLPKGPRRHSAAEPILETAARHWAIETGLNGRRLRLL